MTPLEGNNQKGRGELPNAIGPPSMVKTRMTEGNFENSSDPHLADHPKVDSRLNDPDSPDKFRTGLKAQSAETIESEFSCSESSTDLTANKKKSSKFGSSVDFVKDTEKGGESGSGGPTNLEEKLKKCQVQGGAPGTFVLEETSTPCPPMAALPNAAIHDSFPHAIALPTAQLPSSGIPHLFVSTPVDAHLVTPNLDHNRPENQSDMGVDIQQQILSPPTEGSVLNATASFHETDFENMILAEVGFFMDEEEDGRYATRKKDRGFLFGRDAKRSFFMFSVCFVFIFVAAAGLLAFTVTILLDNKQRNEESSPDEVRTNIVPTMTPTIAPTRTTFFKEIFDVLASSDVAERSVLLDPSSPQYLALNWIVYDDGMALCPDSPNLVQRYALMVLYFGSGRLFRLFVDDTGWASSCHECDWEFVRCGKHVDYEQFVFNPYLNFTTEADLSSCGETRSCEGTEPDWTDLVVTGLHLNERGMSGELVAEIGLLSNLQYLDMRKNNLKGSIPEEIYSLANLEHLILEFNDFLGTLSNKLGVLTKLRTLSLHDNFLEGTVPATLVKLSQMKHLYLHNNKLEGAILPYILQMSELVHMDVGQARFSGTIPPSLGKLRNLEFLFLSLNQFSGPIPPDLCENSPKLEYLSLYGNPLTGHIPESIASCKNLVELSLSSCHLSGTIPAAIGSLSKLKMIDLGVNLLSGRIPSGLHNLTQVEKLGLFTNLLTGTIPSELGLLNNMANLHLQENGLVGHVPKEICELRNTGKLMTLKIDCDKVLCSTECCWMCETKKDP